MSYIILNGINSNTVEGLLIQSLPPITKPKIRTRIETIDGRDGDIITDLGYEAYDRTVKIGLLKNFNINDIIRFFNSSGTMIFSDEPDLVYDYRVLGKIDFERLIRWRQAEVTFHVQPFKHSATEQEQEYDDMKVTETGEIISFEDAVGGNSLPALSIPLPVVQQGTGDPSPSNLREFSGWTQKKVITSGVNMWDDAKFALCNFVLRDTGYYYGKLVDLAALNCGYGLFEKKMPLGRITISFDKLSSSSLRVYMHYTDSETWQNKSGNITAEGHFSYTSDNGRICDGISFDTTAGSTATLFIKNVQISRSSTELPYEAYAGESIPVTWQDQGTVYGGTVDVLRGKLTITHELKTITTTANANVKYSRCTIGDLYYGIGEEETYCNALSVVYVPAAQITSDSIRVFNSTTYDKYIAYIRFADADSATTQTQRTTLTNQILAQMEADGHPLQIVFKLTNPVEYDITPEEITTLLGTNNIWSDTGEITVTYPNRTNITIRNSGNINAKPTITVVGSGDVNLYINGVQVLTIRLGTDDHVTINAEEQNAYKGSSLANRQVTGDYSAVSLEVGDNQIAWVGDVDAISISNYSRWV